MLLNSQFQIDAQVLLEDLKQDRCYLHTQMVKSSCRTTDRDEIGIPQRLLGVKHIESTQHKVN